MTTAYTAYQDSLHANASEMAGRLQAVLGQRLVAFVVGTKSPKTIGRWASGTTDNPTSTEQLGKLRSLFRVVLLLSAHLEDDTVRAWLTSPNPDLGEEVPIELLREGAPQNVLAAAQAFVER